MCSGESSKAFSIVSFQVSSVSWDMPKIRSMLMFRTPLSRRIWKALTAFPASWRRFIQRRMSSLNDWMPMLILFTPKARSPRTYSRPFSTISSGFTSTVNSSKSPVGVVTSTGSVTRESCSVTKESRSVWETAPTIRDKTSRGSTDGVPPPMYRVLTASCADIFISSSFRRSRISAMTASAYSLNACLLRHISE